MDGGEGHADTEAHGMMSSKGMGHPRGWACRRGAGGRHVGVSNNVALLSVWLVDTVEAGG